MAPSPRIEMAVVVGFPTDVSFAVLGVALPTRTAPNGCWARRRTALASVTVARVYVPAASSIVSPGAGGVCGGRGGARWGGGGGGGGGGGRGAPAGPPAGPAPPAGPPGAGRGA